MPDELKNLMLAYSRRGMRDWKNAEAGVKTTAIRCLFNAIAENEDQANWIIGGRHTNGPRFIPMPRHGRKGYQWCFFLPKKANGELRSLVLFMLVNRERRCIAFRFECSPTGSHGYSHIQLTSKLEKLGLVAAPDDDGLEPCVPPWLPDSYPAFPILARNWTEMFLAMMTAIHGHCGGVDVLIKEIFQETQYSKDASKYMDMVKAMLFKIE